MKRKVRSLVALLACAFALVVAAIAIPASAAPAAEYQIYPTPHAISYGTSEQTLRSTASVVVEDGIDSYTVDRLEEALALKSVAPTYVETVADTAGTTSVLVGVKDSGGAVDAYVDKLVEEGKLSYDESIFQKIDAYLLVSLPAADGADQIIVLGKDTDAAFYGLTTLYQIFQQLNGAKLSAFTCEDYADVATRGFIEGYYGNPWSNEDRAELMRWGGYYKLNGYFYAPKDDPKHNSNWRELYTEDELETLIEPLANAGNASKCRFIYALHPFMYSPITSANYDESMVTLKAKFQQVIDHGVRQIAILADDAANQGNQLYMDMLEEMTNWIHDLQAEKNDDGSLKYPGLKDTIIFCPVNYMGSGEAWYAQLSDNISVINTGGEVWGKVDKDFVSTFQTNSGVSPFMWINWPCSDNDRVALHMGGHDEFLGDDLTPGDILGVIVNPMQQSEPSKQGIFMTADFTWNLWEPETDTQQIWDDSFSYVDHGSPIATAGSDAWRELSSHMIRMYGHNVIRADQETVADGPMLDEFAEAVLAGNATEEQLSDARAFFERVQSAVSTYRASGNQRTVNQVVYWLDTWDDVCDAALAYLDAYDAYTTGDTSAMISGYTSGQTSLAASQDHDFFYKDHYEYAAVGRKHVMPAVNALDDFLAEQVAQAVNPDAYTTSYITSRTDSPCSGAIRDALDGDLSTCVAYKDPNIASKGDYFGVTFSHAIDVDRFTVTMTNPADNVSDYVQFTQIQYTKNGTDWINVEGTQTSSEKIVDYKGLGLKDVLGVRIVATQDNASRSWIRIYEIEVNKEGDGGKLPSTGGATEPTGPLSGAVTLENIAIAPGGNNVGNVVDGNDGTFAWFEQDGGADTIPVDGALVLTFDEAATAPSFTVKFLQGQGTADVISNGTLQYRSSSEGEWIDAAAVTSAEDQTFTISPASGSSEVTAQAIRIVNKENTSKWWKVYELSVTPDVESDDDPQTYTGTVTLENAEYAEGSGEAANGSDNNAATEIWVKDPATDDAKNDCTSANVAVVVTFGDAGVRANRINFAQGDSMPGDVIDDGTVYYKVVGSDVWTAAGEVTSDTEQTFDLGEPKQLAAIKVVNDAYKKIWWRIGDLNASYVPDITETVNQDDLYANFDITGSDLDAALEEGSAKVTGSVSAESGNVVAVDLGSVRRDVTAEGTAADNCKLVYSQNALEWVGFNGTTPVRARYVGYQAQADTTISFNDFSVSYLSSLEPSLVKSDVSGSAAFDASLVFDGDVTTSSTIQGYPAKGNTIVFDLGQERSINSLEYFVPETQLNFIRNAVVEAAASPNAADGEWTKVLDINSENPVENVYNEDTAKNATWMTHSSDFPGNMYVSSEDQTDLAGLDVTARYLRVRFTGTYSHRWVCFGELRINGGEYVSTYAGGDFESDVTEQANMTPDKMTDGSLTTAWAPQTESAGTMTYHVSDPLTAASVARQGVRIVSNGTPSGATVKAVVYPENTYATTQEVTLGTLDQVSQEFSFGDKTVKDIVITWDEDVTPQIAEIFLLDTVKTADTTDLENLIAEAKGINTDTWTTNSANALKTALANAEAGVNNTNLTQAAVASLKGALQSAMDGGVTQYTGNLQDLVDEALTDGTGYTTSSWQAYQSALADATAALEDADNLSQAKGDELAAAIEAAKSALAYDATAADRAEQAVADVEAVYTDKAGNYTTGSWNALTKAEQAIEDLLAKGATPAEFTEATQDLYDAVNGLVDVTALLAARADFEATDGTLYTDDSYAAYKKAYDDSTELLASGSADEVAAAVTALQNAKEGLELKTEEPGVDLDKVIADAKGLNPDDYTTSSWAVLQAAIDAAEATHDPAQDEELAKAITDAKTALVNVVALKNAIADAEAIDTTGKTAESVAALKAAIADARALLDDGTQGEVNAAVAAIDAAVKGLVTEGSETPTPDPDDQKPSDTQKPGDTQKPSADGDDTMPATNDPALPAVTVAIVAIILVAVGVVFYVRSRKN